MLNKIDDGYVKELVTAIIDFRGDEDTFVALLKEKLVSIIVNNEEDFTFVDDEDDDIEEEYEDDDFANLNCMDEDFVEGTDEVVEYDFIEDVISDEAMEAGWKAKYF